VARAFAKTVATPADDRVVGRQPAGVGLAGAELKDPHAWSCVGRRTQRRVGRRLGVALTATPLLAGRARSDMPGRAQPRETGKGCAG